MNEQKKTDAGTVTLAVNSMAYISKKNPIAKMTLGFIANDNEKDARILALLTILIAEQMQHEEQLKELRLRIKNVTRLAGITDPVQGN